VEALQADPGAEPTDLGLAYGRAGMVLMAHDLHSAARPAIANAAAYLPEDLRWVYYLGYIDVKIGDIGSAKNAYSIVLESQPEHIGSHLTMAELEAETGDLESARQRLELVLTLDASHARAYELLGDIAAETDEPPIAIAHYLAALQLQPEATRLHAKLAPLYFAAGMEDESRSHEASSGTLPTHYDDPLIVDVLRLNRSATFFVDQGVRFVDAGRLEEAIQHFQRAVSMDPDHVLGLTNLALAHFEAGDLDAALQMGRRSVNAAVAKRGHRGRCGSAYREPCTPTARRLLAVRRSLSGG
jgi:tetratricopeptide (TPR) repeat protein